jgi:hypothetical protein
MSRDKYAYGQSYVVAIVVRSCVDGMVEMVRPVIHSYYMRLQSDLFYRPQPYEFSPFKISQEE